MCKAFSRALLLGLSLLAIHSANAAQLYWNDGSMIHRAALDGSGAQNVAPTFATQGIAVDQSAGLFWTDDVPRAPIGPTGTIRHAGLDGNGQTDVLPGIPTPIGIALDAPHGKMYWTDSANVIHRANLDGTNVENLINQPSVAELSGIVVDAEHNRFYFSFVNPLIDSLRPGGIGSANLDGSNFQITVSALVNPQGLGLDPSGNLYWADVDRIQRAPIGGTAQDLVTGLNRPFGLALDVADQTVFWTDSGAGAIERAPFTGGAATAVLTKLNNPTAIAIVTPPLASGSWDFNGNGSYNDNTKWDAQSIPNGAGLTATLGNGVHTTVNAPAVTVMVDGADTVGSLTFSNTNGTGYILGNDGDASHGLTLNNNGTGAIVTVGANTSQSIFSNLTLADNATFNVSGTSSVLISLGSIGESGGSHGLTKTGSGTLMIDTPSGYTGGTTVNAGTLTTTVTGTMGNGALIVNANGAASVVNLNNNQSLTSLSSTISGGGSARTNVGASTTLAVNQAIGTTFAGTITLAAGATTGTGGTLAKTSGGTLEIDGGISLGNNSSLAISGGILRLSITSGSASVGTGVTANIASSGILELAGSVSALGTTMPASRVAIANSSSAAAGLLISAGNQQVGNIAGSGNVQVNAGASLTANRIMQNALIIGGAAGSPGLVTIDASDVSGSPLAESSGFALASSLEPSEPFGTEALRSSNLLASGGSSESGSTQGGETLGGRNLGSGAGAVPEPTTLLLALLGLATLGCLSRRKQK